MQASTPCSTNITILQERCSKRILANHLLAAAERCNPSSPRSAILSLLASMYQLFEQSHGLQHAGRAASEHGRQVCRSSKAGELHHPRRYAREHRGVLHSLSGPGFIFYIPVDYGAVENSMLKIRAENQPARAWGHAYPDHERLSH